MRIKKYIQNKTFLRLILFFAIIGVAVVFDNYHKGSEKLAKEMHHRSETQKKQLFRVYFYSSVKSIKISRRESNSFMKFLSGRKNKEFYIEKNIERIIRSHKSIRKSNPPVICYKRFYFCPSSGGEDPFPIV